MEVRPQAGGGGTAESVAVQRGFGLPLRQCRLDRRRGRTPGRRKIPARRDGPFSHCHLPAASFQVRISAGAQAGAGAGIEVMVGTTAARRWRRWFYCIDQEIREANHPARFEGRVSHRW